MTDMTTNIKQERAIKIAQKRVEGFIQQFGEAHRNLACHAAFPLVLTPDLLYQIWANFVSEAPWTAVAHVLLSRLCRQVGYEMYEIDIADRNFLLRQLKIQYGQDRFDELGDFLLDYVAQRLTDDDADTQDLREAQEWTALAYTKPNLAVQELAQKLSERVRQQDMGEVLRLASLVETLAEPLLEKGFHPLLIYSQGIKSFFHTDLNDAAARLEGLLDEKNQLWIGSVNLPIPQQIISEITRASKSQNSKPTTVYLKATESGLKIVELARMKKGWSKIDSSWAEAAKISINTLQRFWECYGISKDDFIAICQAVELNSWQDITQEHRIAHEGSYQRINIKIKNAEILIKALINLDINVKKITYIRVDNDLKLLVDVAAILKGNYDLGWCQKSDGYFDMVGYLWGIAQKYNQGDLINSIGFSYKLCQIISEIKQRGIEWGLIELKQHRQDSNFSRLIQAEHKLKLVPELLNLGMTIEQISEALELDIELVSVGVKTNTYDNLNIKTN